MVDAGAQNRKSQGHVHGIAESQRFKHGKSLIVIHRDHHVRVREKLGRECRVRRNRAAHVHTLGAQLHQHRFDHFDLFAAQVTRFAGMRI